tara:strand:- start:184 stop:708 length:525 start_codon:yes stop_codon:yes gene_type:complete
MLRIPFYTLGNWKLAEPELKKLEAFILDGDYYDAKNNLYTTYQKGFVYDFDNFYENRADEIATEQAFKNISKIVNFYWIQVYGKDAVHGKHTHFITGENAIISWVHFLKVPETPCFRFTDGDNYLVPYQNEGDFLVFPSYVQHEVVPHQEDDNRIVVAGNIYIKEHSSIGANLQ